MNYAKTEKEFTRKIAMPVYVVDDYITPFQSVFRTDFSRILTA